jgi:hypothetical protein
MKVRIPGTPGMNTVKIGYTGELNNVFLVLEINVDRYNQFSLCSYQTCNCQALISVNQIDLGNEKAFSVCLSNHNGCSVVLSLNGFELSKL